MSNILLPFFSGPFLDHRRRSRDLRAELLLQRDDRLPVLGHGRHHHHQQDIHRQDLRQGEPQQLRRRRQGTVCTAKKDSNYAFPDIKQPGSIVLNCHIHTSVTIYMFPGSIPLFCCRQIGRPTVGIYKSLTVI